MKDDEIPQSAEDLRVWLRQLKDESEMSFEQIGQAISDTPRNIKRWMPDAKKPTVPSGAVILRLLSALGVKLDPPQPGSLKATNAKIEEVRQIVDRIEAMLQRERSDGLTEAEKIGQAQRGEEEARPLLDSLDPPEPPRRTQDAGGTQG